MGALDGPKTPPSWRKREAYTGGGLPPLAERSLSGNLPNVGSPRVSGTTAASETSARPGGQHHRATSDMEFILSKMSSVGFNGRNSEDFGSPVGGASDNLASAERDRYSSIDSAALRGLLAARTAAAAQAGQGGAATPTLPGQRKGDKMTPGTASQPETVTDFGNQTGTDLDYGNLSSGPYPSHGSGGSVIIHSPGAGAGAGLNSPPVANESRFGSLRSLQARGLLASELSSDATSVISRRNSAASGQAGTGGADSPGAGPSSLRDVPWGGGGGGSWNEDSMELAGAKARAQQGTRSYFQKAEETYQLQVAVALRVMADAELAEETEMKTQEPADLDSETGGAPQLWAGPTQRSQAEATAYRFWVSGCLSIEDRIEDGFYDLWGVSPLVWFLCIDPSQRGRMPNLDNLKALHPSEATFDVTMVHRAKDTQLRELEDAAVEEGFAALEVKTLARQIGQLVANHLGGAVQSEALDLIPRFRQRLFELKSYGRTIVVPIGHLSVGLCRHRAILFKLLMDMLEQKCRIVRGCKHCGMDDGASCIVVDSGLEYVVDLISDPGKLDPSLPAAQYIVASPLRCPSLSLKTLAPTDGADGEPNWLPEFRNFRRPEDNEDMLGSRRLSHAYSNAAAVNQRSPSPRLRHRASMPAGDLEPFTVEEEDESAVQQPAAGGARQKWKDAAKAEQAALQRAPSHPKRASSESPAPRPPAGRIPKIEERLSSSSEDSTKGVDLMPIIMSENVMDVGNMEIIWEDIVLGERVGAGSFGTVYKAEWNSSDVAVKVLINQEQSEEQLSEFKREVIMMEKLRHPNIVLLMGAVTMPPNLSIVTEFLHRGSLFRLLHKPGAKEQLKEDRRMRMAMDVAKGINYLHKCNPTIVHRDLKSPNLLVDKNWTVKVADFGLSANKNSTFLSSKSGAGTPEWMAPEVLRNEPSDEKSDVYSFGVILWEIATLEQPWDGMNPMQVVGAVGFQNKRLTIPSDLNPALAEIILSCWDNKPQNRPGFTEIIAKMKPLVVAATKAALAASPMKPATAAD